MVGAARGSALANSVLRALCMAAVLCLMAATSAIAQPTNGSGAVPSLGLRSPVLILDYDALFRQSRFGRRVLQEIEAEGRALIEQNDRIEAELSAEELMLTSRRDSLTPEEFRELADAFDAKVQQLRGAQQTKAETVGQGRDAEELRFRQLVTPIIARIMQEAGAVVVIDRADSIVWVDAINITDRVLRLADQVIGSGRDFERAQTPEQTASPDAPEDQASPTGAPAEDGDSAARPYTSELGLDTGSAVPSDAGTADTGPADTGSERPQP